MSAFLGPIHFWMYKKIGNQEALTEMIADYAFRQNWIANAEEYKKELPPLETVIDEGNIHGWLQSQITDAETRYAGLVNEILSADSGRLQALCSAALGFGKEHAVEASDAPVAYEAFEDFFVNGMPCDRVNIVTESNSERLSWEMTQDIHAQYWNGDATAYYTIRKSVMNGMLSQSGLKIEMADTTHYTIAKSLAAS